jgi:hypothetical protein
MQVRNRIWFANPIACALVGIAAGLTFVGARIWLNPAADRVQDDWIRHRFSYAAAIAVLVGSTLWLYGRRECGFTTQRRINSAYGFFAAVIAATVLVYMLLGRGPLSVAIAVFLLMLYLWKVWHAGRRLPDAEAGETPST